MTSILIGLGNPGKEYERTRHNAGKMLVEYLVKNPIEGLEVIETNCFMNESGMAVARVLAAAGTKAKGQRLKEEQTASDSAVPSAFSLQPSALFIAHDDLDIPLGRFKIQFGKGPKDHRGLTSIYQSLGTKDFWHVRLGIENRALHVPKGTDYVLDLFSSKEYQAFMGTLPSVHDEIQTILSDFHSPTFA